MVDWVPGGAGRFPSGLPSPPTSFVLSINWWDSSVLSTFWAATSAVGVRVSREDVLCGGAVLFVVVS